MACFFFTRSVVSILWSISVMFPFFPFLVWLMQRSLFRQWISFHWQSHLFDLIFFFFSPSPFFGHDCKPGGIQFVVAVWMETRPPIFFIRLAFVGYCVTARIMYSGGSRWCTNLDNRSSRSSIWGTFERFLSISFVLQIQSEWGELHLLFFAMRGTYFSS